MSDNQAKLDFGRICRKCGQKVEIMQYFKSHICPYCNQPINNIPTEIHIIFKENTDYFSFLLKNYDGTLYESFSEYQVFSLNYFMGAGDLSNLPSSNKETYCLSDIYNTCKQSVKNALEEIKSFDKRTKVFLWVDERSYNDYLNYRYFCKEFKHFDEVYFVLLDRRVKIKNGQDIKKILSKKQRLTDEKIDQLANEFDNLNTRDGCINVLMDGKIASIPLEEVAEKILPFVKKRFESQSYVENRYFKKYKDTSYNLDFYQSSYVFSYLHDAGKIEYKYEYIEGWLPENKIRLKN